MTDYEKIEAFQKVAITRRTRIGQLLQGAILVILGLFFIFMFFPTIVISKLIQIYIPSIVLFVVVLLSMIFRSNVVIGEILFHSNGFFLRINGSGLEKYKFSELFSVQIKINSYKGRLVGIFSLVPEDGSDNKIIFFTNEKSKHSLNFKIQSRDEFLFLLSYLKKCSQLNSNIKIVESL